MNPGLWRAKSVLFAAVAFAPGAWGAVVHYPANPLRVGEAVYFSRDGISRHDSTGPRLVWRALRGVHTFEPVSGGSILIVGSAAGLYALDTVDGRLRWRLASNTPVYTPAVADGIAYAGDASGQLRAIALTTGRVLWSRQLEGWIYPPAVGEDLLVAGGSGASLYGIERDTGRIRWRQDVPNELVYRPVAIGGHNVAVTYFNGNVRVLRFVDGGLVWRAVDGTPSYSPLVVGRRAFFGGYDGTLRVRDVASGRLLWRYTGAAPFKSIPAPAGGDIVVPSGRGKIMALDARTGRLSWTARTQDRFAAADQGRVLVFKPDHRAIVLRRTLSGDPSFSDTTYYQE